MDTFSSSTLFFGSDRTWLRIIGPLRLGRPPCRGQGVGQLALDGCAICTRRTPPFSDRREGKPKGGCSMDGLIEREIERERLYDRGLVGVAANVAHCPSSMAVCPPPLLRLISAGHASRHRITSPQQINLSLARYARI